MEELLVATLLADTTIAPLVEDADGDRINWVKRRQGAQVPAIVLHRISGGREYHLAGAAGLVASRVQVDCYATTYGAAKRLARGVVAAVSGEKIVGEDATLHLITVDAERDSSEDEETRTLFRTSLDLTVWHTEP